LQFCGQDNKTSNSIFDERLGKNVIWFHGTHTYAISFTLIKKVQCQYSCNPHMSNSIMHRSRAKFHPKWITDIESTHRNCALKTFHVYRTHSYSVHILDIPSTKFLSKSDKTRRKEGNQLLGNVRLSVQIFTNQTAQRHYTECFYAAFHPELDNQYQEHGYPLIKVKLSLSRLSQNSSLLKTYCRSLPYQIS
jgi:hypothetical protein